MIIVNMVSFHSIFKGRIFFVFIFIYTDTVIPLPVKKIKSKDVLGTSWVTILNNVEVVFM